MLSKEYSSRTTKQMLRGKISTLVCSLRETRSHKLCSEHTSCSCWSQA